jgi:hypothetical protein
MEPNLFIKYKGIDSKHDSNIELFTLGESIIGLDRAIKDIFKISKIVGDLNISISGTRKGSLIIETVNSILLLRDIPFEKVEDLLNFLKIMDKEIYLTAQEYFSPAIGTTVKTNRTLDSFFTEHPFLSAAIMSYFPQFIEKILSMVKKSNDLLKTDLYGESISKIVKQGGFKKLIKPIVDETVASIEISPNPNFVNKVAITSENFENYLSEDQKILPQYVDGSSYKITGKIISMQCGSGDSMKIRVHGIAKPDRDLIAYPPEGTTTKELENFYEEDVIIEAIIRRDSLYKKPHLLVQEINLYQQPMFLQ